MLNYCSKAEFLKHINEQERILNAGALTFYDSLTDQTQWKIGQHIVGLSGGTVGESQWYKKV